MTYIQKPINHHPNLKKNKLGLTRRDYEGAVSSLCAGCGHDSISAAIIDACFELNIEAYKVAKLSGIGCSSKAPAYFLMILTVLILSMGECRQLQLGLAVQMMTFYI